MIGSAFQKALLRKSAWYLLEKLAKILRIDMHLIGRRKDSLFS